MLGCALAELACLRWRACVLQDAMRQQCVQNIAVSTVRSGGSGGAVGSLSDDPDAISTCEAWTAPTSSTRLASTVPVAALS